ncbi:MAG TPA: hypothetical protein VGR93_05250 [Candidatus Acidoferrales bacterium]|nr:hypothetical protein [Candidatus Acidoferrales bacterium]
MGKYKLPFTLAIIGFAIGITLCAAWFYIDSHDVFTKRVYWSSPNGTSGFDTPAYDHFETLTFVLCPPSVILIATMDFGDSPSAKAFTAAFWFAAAFLNGLLYFLLGLPIAFCWNRWQARHTSQST